MEPQIRYVRSADGTNIAYTVMGEGVPMIFSPNIWCHLSIQLSGEFRRLVAIVSPLIGQPPSSSVE